MLVVRGLVLCCAVTLPLAEGSARWVLDEKDGGEAIEAECHSAALVLEWIPRRLCKRAGPLKLTDIDGDRA